MNSTTMTGPWALAVLAQGDGDGGGGAAATSQALGSAGKASDGSTTAAGSQQPPGQGGTQPKSPFGSLMIWIPLLAVLVFMIVSSMSSSKKEKRKRAELLSSLKKQDRVQTIGGVIGTVVELTADEVVLRVDDSSKAKIHFSRSAIQQVLRSGGGGASSNAPDKAEESVV